MPVKALVRELSWMDTWPSFELEEGETILFAEVILAPERDGEPTVWRVVIARTWQEGQVNLASF